MASIIDMHHSLGDGCRTPVSMLELLHDMDTHGVERSVVCSMDQYVVVRNQEGNNQIIQAVGAHPDRVTGFAVVNPWWGQKGWEELCRCADGGLRGLALYPHLQGCTASDPLVQQLVATAADLQMIVWCHCGTPTMALPFNLMELACMFPQVTFVMGTPGYADAWYDVIPAMTLAPNLVVDTSHGPPGVLDELLNTVGHQRLVFASDAPTSTLAGEALKIALLDTDDRSKQAILADNARRILADDRGGAA